MKINSDIFLSEIVGPLSSAVTAVAMGYLAGRRSTELDIPKLVGKSLAIGFAGAVGWGLSKYVAKRMENEETDIPEEPENLNEEPEHPAVEEAHISYETERLFPEEYAKPPLLDYTKFHKQLAQSTKEAEPSIFAISAEEYLTMEPKGYAKADGTYFTEDGILAGWNDKLDIRSAEDTIGNEALDLLKQGDSDTVYVRNAVLKVDYQITRSESSYDDAVEELRWSSDIPAED